MVRIAVGVEKIISRKSAGDSWHEDGLSGMALASAKLFVEEGAYVFIAGRKREQIDIVPCGQPNKSDRAINAGHLSLPIDDGADRVG